MIVRSTIDLARNLGLRVVAEGVEDRPLLDRAARARLRLAQGYYISRPLPERRLLRWCDSRRSCRTVAPPRPLVAAGVA